MTHASLHAPFVPPADLRPQKTMQRNDPCWCGSGKKWKKCHRDRESQQPVELGERLSRLYREFQKGYCSHPQARSEDCGHRIIRAHTVQLRGGLAAIAENGHVISAKTGSQRAESGRATVRLVFDREHEAIMRDWSASAQHRLLVFSHRLGPAAESRLVRSGESTASLFIVVYGLTDLSEEWLSRIDGIVRRARGTVAKLPHMHAKTLVSDTSVCVSSYNFLSVDPFGTADRARELGVIIEGGDVATWIAERLEKING